MLRIHFTARDLGLVRLATEPDPLWETVLGLHKLGPKGRGLPVYSRWRAAALTELNERRAGAPLTFLRALVPENSTYFPDFLTPAESAGGLTAGLRALRATPPARLAGDLAFAARLSRLPRWCAALAEGDADILGDLGDAVKLVHGAVVEPGWNDICAAVDADRASRVRAQAAGGTVGLLDSLRPVLRWSSDELVLEADYPADLDIALDGRGLTLIPSFFCWRTPVALVDPELAPVVVYPVDHATTWAAAGVRRRGVDALARVLGPTRAGILAAVEAGTTTGELARRFRVAPATASEHVSALRDARLVVSHRDGAYHVHTLTPLGAALLHNELPPGQT
ncbi:ArsR/SmtB family transcription factor [Streptomyces sp. NPDC058665]|uniref:ArsR/SmtB family transcription factor n=1 Tax=Streptomyces sp. NPDC058665 TaxID=3346586 RepID=UPI0036651A9C